MDKEEKSQDRRVKKTKNAIYEAFQSLLLEKTYSEITVKELTERADITRKTFYLHYGTLDDVLYEFVSGLLFDIREEIISPNPKVEESGILSEFEVPDYPELFIRMNRDFSREHLKMRNLMNDNASRQIVYQVLMEQQKKMWEIYQKRYGLSPEMAKLYGTFTTYGFNAMFMTWYTDPDTIPMEEFAEMTRDIAGSLYKLPQKWGRKTT